MKVWAYIHPELNILCCALLPEAVPQGIQAIEFDVESPDDVYIENGQIKVKTQEQKIEEYKSLKLEEMKGMFANKMAETDYVVVKIKEAEFAGADVDSLKAQYQPIIQKRQQLRSLWEQTEQAILQAKTKEEIDAIAENFRKAEAVEEVLGEDGVDTQHRP